MVAQEVQKFSKRFHLLSGAGVEDFSDKFASRYVVAFLWVAAMIVGVNTYVLQPISCVLSSSLRATQFEDYVTSYCWTHGTIPLGPHESIPYNKEAWKIMDRDRRVTYYQWIVLVLGLQSIAFLFPRWVWMFLSPYVTDSNLEMVMKHLAEGSAEPSPSKRSVMVNNIVTTLEDVFTGKAGHSYPGFNEEKKCSLRSRWFSTPIFVYLLSKLLHITNCVIQLIITTRFIGQSSILFGWNILNNLINGIPWSETMSFPRRAYCFTEGVRTLGNNDQYYMAQCILSSNMLSEKIYLVFWWMIVTCLFLLCTSLLVWIYRMSNRNFSDAFILRHLRHVQLAREDGLLARKCFVKNFLKRNGVFILSMMGKHTSHGMMKKILEGLYEIYAKKYRDLILEHNAEKMMQKGDSDTSKLLHLEKMQPGEVHIKMQGMDTNGGPGLPAAGTMVKKAPYPNLVEKG